MLASAGYLATRHGMPHHLRPEVKDLRAETLALKECAVDLTLRTVCKKSMPRARDTRNGISCI